MKNVRMTIWAVIVVLGVLLAFNSGTQALTIDWVAVGNAGNAGEQSRLGYGDTTYYGGVNYEYQISTYEVTAGQYTEFLNAVAATIPYGLYSMNMWSNSYGCKIQQSGNWGSYTYSVASDQADRPVTGVSWYDTLRFSNWLHNGQPTGPQTDATTEDGAYDMSLGDSVVRKAGAQVWLPSEDEWYKAAYHKNDGVTGNYFDYPTSSDMAPGYVDNSGNLSGTVTPFAEGGMGPGNYATYDGDSGTVGIGSPYYRTEVGEWENSDSPYGTFDMGGNVWEWNETLFGSHRGLRGGSFPDNGYVLASSYWADFSPNLGNPDIGFRVASVPEPCSLVLLSLGGLMLRRRRT